jgi:adenosylhomocysteine nucleosidase
MKRLAIVSATIEEQDGITEQLVGRYVQAKGGRNFIMGHFRGVPVVCVLCGIGKVAAAITTTLLIVHFGVSHIVFTGVAGSGDQFVDVGDVVIGSELIHHDMDCQPMFNRFQVPGHPTGIYDCDEDLSHILYNSVGQFFMNDLRKAVSVEDREIFNIGYPNIFCGLIATGDQFIACEEKMAQLKTELPDVQAVEMEGAAIGQVCYEFSIPFAIMRTISDKANETSSTDYPWFIRRIAAQYALGIMTRMCDSIAEKYFNKT